MQDIGDHCVECGCSTAFGSGNFVNRIPADNGVKSGYMCAECQCDECEVCGESTPDWTIVNDVLHCDECFIEHLRNQYEQNEANNLHTENLLMLAEHFGTRAEYDACVQALKSIELHGHSTMSDAIRSSINSYYYDYVQAAS